MAPAISLVPRSHWKEIGVPTPSGSTSDAAAESVSPRRSVVVPREALVVLLIETEPETGSLTFTIALVGLLVSDSVVPPPSVCVAFTEICFPTSAWTRV